MGFLRIALAFIVMLAHLNILPGELGPIAVCCFFVISGFYMQLLLTDKSLKTSDFYQSRALRIYPAYWLFVALDIWLAKGFSLTPLTAISTAFIFGRDIFSLAGVALPVVPAWSLATELCFYVLAPFILRWSTKRLIALGAPSLLCNILVMAFIAKGINGWAVAVFPSDLCFFLAGSLAYRIKAQTNHITGLILFVLALASLHGIVLYYALPAITTVWLSSLFRASRYSSSDRFIGNLSYPVYLSHTVIAPYLLLHGINSIVLATGAIAVVSILVYRFLELPIDNFRHKKFSTAKE
jgi:peptidoglycan/LPS O-acetylase OafA/YrhL